MRSPDPAASFNWAFDRIRQQLKVVLVATVVPFGALFILGWLYRILLRVAFPNPFDQPSFFAGMVYNSVFGVLVFPLIYVALVPLYRLAWDATEDRYPTLVEIRDPAGLATPIATAAILGALVGAASLFLYIPSLIVAYLGSLAIFAAFDGAPYPLAALRRSLSVIVSPPGAMAFAACALMGLAGAVLACVGAIASVPFAVFATAYNYRAANGQPFVAGPLRAQ